MNSVRAGKVVVEKKPAQRPTNAERLTPLKVYRVVAAPSEPGNFYEGDIIVGLMDGVVLNATRSIIVKPYANDRTLREMRVVIDFDVRSITLTFDPTEAPWREEPCKADEPEVV